MSPEILLANFDRVSDAPDAIPNVRRFVLDLAVRGKLVDQNLADEHASKLLERIATEKERMVKAGEIKPQRMGKSRVPPPARFDLPINWAWTGLQAICISVTDGDHMPPPKAKEGVPFLVISNVRTQTINYQSGRWVPHSYYEALDPNRRPRPGDVLYTLVGSFGIPVEVLDEKEFCVQRHIGIIRPAYQISNPFLARIMGSKFIFDQAVTSATGIAQKTVPLSGLRSFLIPLPPLAEQRRIVAKIDELMALCDSLEATRTTREGTRDLLTKASHSWLSVADTADVSFRSQARFAIGALPALTARANQVKHLRQTILELAVRGELVKQDPEDEPPPRLDSAIPHDLRLPFPVPPNWRWSRLRALGILKGGGTPSKARDDFWNGSIFWVSPKDMKVDYIAETQLKITEAAITGSAVKLIEAESILFVVRGMILAHSFPVAISRVPLTINQDMKAIALKKSEMAEYLLRALKGLKLQILKRVKRSSHGTCRIESRDYRDFMIPLPPLAEQHRIVTRVDELMALCDQLEVSLGTVDKGRQRFLESLLREALEPPIKEMNAVVYGAADRDVRATGFRTAPPIRGALDQWLNTGEVSAESER